MGMSTEMQTNIRRAVRNLFLAVHSSAVWPRSLVAVRTLLQSLPHEAIRFFEELARCLEVNFFEDHHYCGFDMAVR